MRRVPVVVALTVFALAACTTAPTDATAGGPLIVATTSVLGDITRNVAPVGTRVEVLVEAGVDPHAYRPSAAEGRLLRAADLVVANGLGLEASLVPVLETVEAEGVPVFEATDHVELLGLGGAEHDHEHGPLDPHILLDPLRGAEVVEALGDLLDEHERASAYAAVIRDAHEEIVALLAPVPEHDREVLSTHEAFRYFAHRYDLALVGSVIPGGSTLAETSARDFIRLARRVAARDVTAILTEASSSTRLADALAREVGGLAVVEVHTDALGVPGSAADSYVGLLRADGRRIAEALR